MGSSLSCLDVLGVLYFDILKKNEYVILSKGHAATSLYTILHLKGILTASQLKTFHVDSGTHLGAHPSQALTSHIPFSTGSLGGGLSLAAGMAHGNILTKRKCLFTYCVLSDGECNEGQTWEAAQYASSKNIHNLICLIDKNKWQAFGRTKDVLGDHATVEIWKAFGFETLEVDGHKPMQMYAALKRLRSSLSLKPKMLICNTIKGFGMGEYQDTLASHYLPIDEDSKRVIDKFIDALI